MMALNLTTRSEQFGSMGSARRNGGSILDQVRPNQHNVGMPSFLVNHIERSDTRP